MQTSSTATSAPRFTAALSGHLDAIAAADHAAETVLAGLGGMPVDLGVVFFSSHHAHQAMGVVAALRSRLKPGVLIGCSAEMVMGGETEMEGVPGLTLMGASLPGVRLHTFGTAAVPTVRDDAPEDLDQVAKVAGFGEDHRATLLLADPFSTPSGAILPALAKARNKHGRARSTDSRPSPIIGGFASSAGRPGGNVIIVNDQISNAGGVGLSMSGNIRVDSLVSQGCKPIGTPMVVTAGKGQMITQLGGRPALEVLSGFLDALDMNERQKLRGGLYIGRAINEYKKRFGRDDFLIRNVIGVERGQKAVAVADIINVGQTVQFHIRDAQTAGEDLALLLDAQKLHDAPLGVLTFNCNGRGTRLFGTPHHDAAAIARAFAPAVEAPQQARGGEALPPPSGHVPLAGLFCAGEIGPIGDEVFVHGQTLAAALFRRAEMV